MRAAVPAGVFSGVPSTLYAVAAERDPLEASLAAGSILLPNEVRRARLLLAAALVHAGLSAAWGALLAVVLPHRNPLAGGVVAGAAIAALDVGLVGRRIPRIRALPVVPQVADHIAFGVITAWALARQRSVPVVNSRAQVPPRAVRNPARRGRARSRSLS